MRTFSINTLGCKVNQYESQQIRELLERHGLRKTEWPEKPDLAVVHTCCVTGAASAKSRQCIQKVRRQSPDAFVLVSGCLPTVQTDELSISAANVHLVRNRSDLAATLTHLAQSAAAAPVPRNAQFRPDIVIRARNSLEIKQKNDSESQSWLPPLTSFKEHTRAFLKVQDGCDGLCSYCIVPKTRPIVHSKPANEVLFEAQTLVKSGHKEIVVTGVFLGAYGQESVRRRNWPDRRNDNLADLLDKMAKIQNLARIRLSSLEPADVTAQLLDTFCEHRNIMPHLHLSLQSGSDAVLKRMCRQYTADQFRQKVESIKAKLDRPAVTTDIIVGFPGETDADFERTVDLAKSVGFAKMHVFTFSPRRGTAAARMQDAVDNKVTKERSRMLRELDAELGLEYRGQFLGKTAQVLIENDNGQLCGRSERHFRVYLNRTAQARVLKNNDLVAVRLLENRCNGMIGEPLS